MDEDAAVAAAAAVAEMLLSVGEADCDAGEVVLAPSPTCWMLSISF